MRRATVLTAWAVVALAGCGGGGDAEHKAPPRPSPSTLGPDHATYTLDLRVTRRLDLAGTERIAFRNAARVPLQVVWLRAWGNAFGTCARQPVRVVVSQGGEVSARRRGCTALEVRLPRPLAPGATATIGLRFTASAPPRPDRFGRDAGLAYYGNAIPVLAVTEPDGHTELPPYTFRGDAFYSLAAAWRVHLELPPGVQAATTGTESPRGEYRTTARDFALVVGPMRVTRRTVDSVTLRWFAAVRDPPGPARQALRVAARTLVRYTMLYGPYGSPELDLVRGPRTIASGAIGMEYPQLVLTDVYPQAITHELAHQWFYAIVGDDQWTTPWVDESLAEYLANHLPPALHGRSRLRCLDHDRPLHPPRPLDASMGTFDHSRRRAYVNTVYVDGPCVLFQIGRAAGFARVDALLHRLVNSHRDGILTSAELARALRTLRGGRRALDAVGIRG